MEMSFRERSLWGSLLITIGVFGAYFISMFSHGTEDLTRLISTVILVIILETIYHTVIATIQGPEARDERDVYIELKGSRSAYGVMVYGSVMLIGHLVFTTMFKPEHVLSQMQIANVLLGMFILAESISFAVQIIAYRRGS